ncbi:polyprenyl synthetase family protein [Kineococcus gynurae]|uniref:Polyprenyl synthetase family protein n=1 Tax=Kineococcus gynurae TaxID=452979 RepID=A0ABV5LUB3_9ACTN
MPAFPPSAPTAEDGLAVFTGAGDLTARLRQDVQSELTRFLARQRAVLAEVSPETGPMLDAVESLLSGGKRLRPAFCFWGFLGAGGLPGPEITTAAAALELFQAAALLHDDVMDDSDTRRGLPAAHRRFAALHAELRWSGSAERFGLAGAILAGDLCLSWSDEMFVASGFDEPALARGRAVFSTMRTQLMGGQYLDMLEQASSALRGREGAVERARRVVRFKSAKYSVEHPLLLGAALAGAPAALQETYTRFGLALGEAFQLRDDVLGVFGDPGQTGKPAGDDLREGKRTVLVALALAAADPAQVELVESRLGDPQLDAEGVVALQTVLTDTGAVAGVERLIDDLVEEACTALEKSSLDETARTALNTLVVAATARLS